MKDENSIPAEADLQEQASRRKQLRTLILGTLTATGAFHLDGWQAQAHGNRSSHSTAALRSDLFMPQDYVTFRQQVTAPNAAETATLSQITHKIKDLQFQSTLSLSERTDLDSLQKQLDSLEEKRRLRETSGITLDLIRQGDIDGAVAAIEGTGDPERVTYEYLWVITDLAYLGRKGNQLTAENQSELLAISQRGIRYADSMRDILLKQKERSATETVVLTRIAEIYHNIASYLVPDIGQPSPAALAVAFDAAQKSKDLRADLGQPTEMLIAEWTVARLEALRGNEAVSERLHKEAITRAERMGDVVQVAWNKYSLARLSSKKSTGENSIPAPVREEIDRLLSVASPDDPSAALLRLEMKHSDY
jgi:hypothetical protein